jgi:GNAT acetyltransferase-like protein
VTLEVWEGTAPPGWDERVRAAGGNLFATELWARFRCDGGGGEPVFFAWSHASDIWLGLGVRRPTRHSLLGRVVSRLAFDTAPAGPATDVDLTGTLARWARRSRAVVEVQLGSYDAVRPWGSLPDADERLEFFLDAAGESEIRRGVRKGTRASIRRAEQLGLTVHEARGTDDVTAFVALYDQTLRRLEATKGVARARHQPSRLADAIAMLIEHGGAHLYLASLAGEAQAGCLFGVFGQRAYYLYNGASPAALASGATPLALLAALSDLSGRGYEHLNLGGVAAHGRRPDSPDHGLYAFKLGLGTRPVACTSATMTIRPLRAKAVALAAGWRQRHSPA